MTDDNNILVNNIGDNNNKKNQSRYADKDLFTEEFALAKEYLKKKDLKRKQEELDIFPYFNYFFYNDNPQEKESVIDRIGFNNKKNDLNSHNNNLPENKKRFYEPENNNKIKIIDNNTNPGKNFLKINLADNYFLINLNKIINQYSYNSIIDFFKQAVKIEDIANTIIEKANLLKNGELVEFEIDFNPDFIGNLKLKLTMIDGKLGITIFASEDLKKLIEDSLGILKNNLVKSNLTVDNLVILSQNEQRKEKNNYRYFKNFYGQINGKDENENFDYYDYNENYSIINYIA